jgi:hypothetical protein
MTPSWKKIPEDIGVNPDIRQQAAVQSGHAVENTLFQQPRSKKYTIL